MQVLAVDVGTTMQNVLLLDDEYGALKLSMPSPTALVARAIRAATRRGDDLYLTGVTMGGGPCMWAVRNHLQAGYRAYATPDAAYTFNDNLDMVQEMGIAIVGEHDRPKGTVRLEMHDFDLATIEHAFMACGVRVNPDAIAVAVFDHGVTPPGVSSQVSRFEYLTQRVRARPDLIALAYMRPDIPTEMLRMRAVATSVPPTVPLMVMDTGFAALLGSCQDGEVCQHDPAVLLNLGSMHTLALHVQQGQLVGLFEHHTDMLSPTKLNELLNALLDGTLSSQTIESDQGHGGWAMHAAPVRTDFLAVTGPRYDLVCESGHPPHFAMPHGDGVAPGCWGLVGAYATLSPEAAPRIDRALARVP